MYKECCSETIKAKNLKEFKTFSAHNVDLSNSDLFHAANEMPRLFYINIALTTFDILFLQYQWTPLHRAARRGHSDVVKELLKCGANPNITNSVRAWF